MAGDASPRLEGRQIALYGRFRARPRAEIAAAAEGLGARIVTDLTRATDLFVVGAGATNFVANGHLAQRLAAARARGAPVAPEERFLALLSGAAPPPAPTAPLASASAPEGPPPEPILDLLNAFGLIQLEQGAVRFADAAVLRAASALYREDPAPLPLIAALLRHRDAPAGRHQLVSGEDGAPLLAWEDGLTTLEGQGLLDLEPAPSLEEAFEAAMMAEAEDDLETAERLYATCARADRRDPIAPFNRANALLRLGDPVQAVLAYRQAIARDAAFAEAHYNLAAALERQGDLGAAEAHLETALKLAPDYPDALFNLGQLRLKDGDGDGAAPLFERFLATEPSAYWRRKGQAALILARGPAGAAEQG